MMAELAQGFVVLPGGYGTLDEMFEIITWRQIGLHEKPILIVDIDGYWSHLSALFDRIHQEGFAYARDRSLTIWVDGVEAVLPTIQPLLSRSPSMPLGDG